MTIKALSVWVWCGSRWWASWLEQPLDENRSIPYTTRKCDLKEHRPGRCSLRHTNGQRRFERTSFRNDPGTTRRTVTSPIRATPNGTLLPAPPRHPSVQRRSTPNAAHPRADTTTSTNRAAIHLRPAPRAQSRRTRVARRGSGAGRNQSNRARADAENPSERSRRTAALDFQASRRSHGRGWASCMVWSSVSRSCPQDGGWRLGNGKDASVLLYQFSTHPTYLHGGSVHQEPPGGRPP